MFDMNRIVGHCDLVFITLDTLRFDVAQQLLLGGELPTLSQWISAWEPRHTPASFTYAAHHAFFSGFFPTPINEPKATRPMAVSFSGSVTQAATTKSFQQSTLIEGLEAEGYHTICIGGVGFFNLQTALGCVLPNLFQEKHWRPELGVTEKQSTRYQVAQAVKSLNASPEKTFLFMNISAIHQPNYFYLDDPPSTKIDTKASHAAALKYVDSQLPALLAACQRRRDTYFIVCSDHGTAYGEEGYQGHRLAHETVWTVPYAEFLLEASV